MWMQVFESFFVATGPAVALAWLLERILTHRLTKDAESFKTKLSADAALQLEQFRASLQRENRENEIRFAARHARLDERLAELYGAVVDANARINGLMTSASLFIRKPDTGPPFNFESIQREGFDTMYAAQAATRFLGGLTLYLPATVAASVEKVIDRIRAGGAGIAIGPMALPVTTMRDMFERLPANTDQERVRIVYEWWLGEDWGNSHREAVEALQASFRELLGTEGRVTT